MHEQQLRHLTMTDPLETYAHLLQLSPQTETLVAALANTGPTTDGRFVQAGCDVPTGAAHRR